ncbi:ABC transporter substrate-binding protein [Tepidiforma sp.]|uniref:ABC transporter substrate-binding protein n=1 Tax=Tepidiforma sp. TaxID=2682230 RepID=UPI002ADD81D3|nr:ABC transporter substrate-binding protein [Tepidiforma sp.]
MNRILLAALALLILPVAAACGSGGDDENGTPPQQQATSAASPSPASQPAQPTATPVVASFPVTVELEGRKVTIAQRPQRIVALSNDVADIAIRLAGPERVAAAPESNANASLAAGADAAGRVATKLPPGTKPEPESIVALRPDLVLISARHGGEQDAAKQLEQLQIPLLVFAHWGTPEEIAENVRAIGKAVGEPQRAEALIAEMMQSVDRVQKAVKNAPTKPRVLALSDQANRPFIVGKSGGGITPTLVSLAGGEVLSETGGPAQAESVAALNPDVILIVDVWGKGLTNYRALLDSPGVRELPAVRDNRIIVLPAWQIFLPTDRVGAGVESLARALHPGALPQ